MSISTAKPATLVKTGGVITVNSTETYHSACIAELGIIQVLRVGGGLRR
ncbi:yhjC domain protein [Candidatus Erwinia dacicola]|uniref:YhjC domain protein n=1 Tax=Candidatus Erwinia dacicola TaxID=252393 RepID=A0A328TLZ0_9GAMM|nr:yhjC domain protein [Candidatus Erwinia dacicola]